MQPEKPSLVLITSHSAPPEPKTFDCFSLTTFPQPSPCPPRDPGHPGHCCLRKKAVATLAHHPNGPSGGGEEGTAQPRVAQTAPRLSAAREREQSTWGALCISGDTMTYPSVLLNLANDAPELAPEVNSGRCRWGLLPSDCRCFSFPSSSACCSSAIPHPKSCPAPPGYRVRGEPPYPTHSNTPQRDPCSHPSSSLPLLCCGTWNLPSGACGSIPGSRPRMARVRPLWLSVSGDHQFSASPSPSVIEWSSAVFAWPQTNGPAHRSIASPPCISKLASRPEPGLFYCCFLSQTFKNNICPSRGECLSSPSALAGSVA